jgi:predicted NBD/HSP70 family sugar kinase
VLGIELRPEVCNAVIIDLDGTVVGSRSLPIQVEAGNIRETFPPVLAALREEFGGAGTGAPLLGIGVGTPGVVNPQKGVIRYSIPLQIEQPAPVHRQRRQRLRVGGAGLPPPEAPARLRLSPGGVPQRQ